MFEVKNSVIHCSRGDEGTITLRIPITDSNNYIKYKDESNNEYWYDKNNQVLYDTDYKEVSMELNTLNIVYYEFEKGDIITFNIYNKNGYGNEPLLNKIIEVLESTYSIDITLNEKDTTFCNAINKATVFWYDITLNNSLTVVCFNEDGAKEFILYPAKGEDE